MGDRDVENARAAGNARSQPPAPPASRRVYWIGAAAAAAIVIGVLVLRPRGPEKVGVGYGDMDSQREVEAERNRAFSACDQGHWVACKDGLDEAQSMDPAGEASPRVVAARQAIQAATADAGRTPEKPPKP